MGTELQTGFEGSWMSALGQTHFINETEAPRRAGIC